MLAALISIASGETSRVATRMRRAMIDYLIAGIALAIGVGFFIAAAYIFVAERYGPFYAALGFGVGFVIIAAVALIVHRLMSRAQARRRADEARANQMKTMASAAALAVLPALLNGRGGLLKVIVPVLAVVAYTIYRENTDQSQDDPDI